MKFWTVSYEYYATGEGVTACVWYFNGSDAESSDELFERVAKGIGNYIARGATIREGLQTTFDDYQAECNILVSEGMKAYLKRIENAPPGEHPSGFEIMLRRYANYA